MLQNLNLMNSSHYGIFKYIGFVPNHYVSVINLNIVPFFSIFNKFDCISKLDILLV